MRNKFVYPCSIKIHPSGIQQTLRKHFLPPAVPLQKVVEMLEEVTVSWRESGEHGR